jgi:hypothetical protein
VDAVTKLHKLAADWRKWSSNQLAAGYSTSAMIIDMCADELAAALAEQDALRAEPSEQEVERAVDAYTSALGTREQRLAAALQAARSRP